VVEAARDLRFFVHVMGATPDTAIAAFQFEDQAIAWIERYYRSTGYVVELSALNAAAKEGE
jgi:hypothetical protein